MYKAQLCSLLKHLLRLPEDANMLCICALKYEGEVTEFVNVFIEILSSYHHQVATPSVSDVLEHVRV